MFSIFPDLFQMKHHGEEDSEPAQVIEARERSSPNPLVRRCRKNGSIADNFPYRRFEERG